MQQQYHDQPAAWLQKSYAQSQVAVFFRNQTDDSETKHDSEPKEPSFGSQNDDSDAKTITRKPNSIRKPKRSPRLFGDQNEYSETKHNDETKLTCPLACDVLVFPLRLRLGSSSSSPSARPICSFSFLSSSAPSAQVDLKCSKLRQMATLAVSPHAASQHRLPPRQ